MRTAAEMKAWAVEVVRGFPGVPPYVLVLRGVLKGACLVDATMTDAAKYAIQKAALQALEESQR